MTHLLRSLVRQIQLESNRPYKPEAPADAPLGKYAFALNRVGRRKPPREKNTEIENQLFQSLRRHFDSGNTPLSKEEVDQVIGFINQGLYTDVFKVPKVKTLYRGITLSYNKENAKLIEKFLPPGISFADIFRQQSALKLTNNFLSFKAQIDLTNKAGKHSASWTKSLSKAKEFASVDHKNLAIIFCATVADNPGKWIDCEGLYDLIEIADYADEREVIATGTIRVDKVMIRFSHEIIVLQKLIAFESLPKNKRILNGDIRLADLESNSNNITLPNGLQIKGSLNVRGTSITSLPEDLKITGNLNCAFTKITFLPKGLVVIGDIIMTGTNIKSLPDDMQIKGSLSLRSSKVTSLPKGLHARKVLDLSQSDITSLPDGLKVDESLYLQHTSVTSLPADLSVGGNLDLTGTGITSLPAGLQIGGGIFGLKHEYWKNVPKHLRDKLR